MLVCKSTMSTAAPAVWAQRHVIREPLRGADGFARAPAIDEMELPIEPPGSDVAD